MGRDNPPAGLTPVSPCPLAQPTVSLYLQNDGGRGLCSYSWDSAPSSMGSLYPVHLLSMAFKLHSSQMIDLVCLPNRTFHHNQCFPPLEGGAYIQGNLMQSGEHSINTAGQLCGRHLLHCSPGQEGSGSCEETIPRNSQPPGKSMT